MEYVWYYGKLIGRIAEIFGTRRAFAAAMQSTEKTLKSKLSNRIPWRQDEIALACELLELSYDDIPAYFFVKKVQ